MTEPTIKIPNQNEDNKPQGPSIFEALPREFKAVVTILVAIHNQLQAISDKLSAGPPAK